MYIDDGQILLPLCGLGVLLLLLHPAIPLGALSSCMFCSATLPTFPTKPKKQYFQIFREFYKQDFPCILKSDKGHKFAFCSICCCNFIIACDVKNDITNHLKCSKHVINIKSAEQNKKKSVSVNFFVVVVAQTVSLLISCWNIIFLLSESARAVPLFKKMFPRSEVGKRYDCGRTKTSAIMQEMAEDTCRNVVDSLQ
ncbi:hypothetical protein PR048_030425 [Dryococelus australis]|uniref:Uncharacterized protein n=1 Tax=Dryococelus australis TaxID=614101 RepID=A0ABQ9G8Y4_9NEOP|nr:hypothetical protein PR048_030425 [Dryococelus australis]